MKACTVILLNTIWAYVMYSCINVLVFFYVDVKKFVAKSIKIRFIYYITPTRKYTMHNSIDEIPSINFVWVSVIFILKEEIINIRRKFNNWILLFFNVSYVNSITYVFFKAFQYSPEYVYGDNMLYNLLTKYFFKYPRVSTG